MMIKNKKLKPKFGPYDKENKRTLRKPKTRKRPKTKIRLQLKSKRNFQNNIKKLRRAIKSASPRKAFTKTCTLK